MAEFKAAGLARSLAGHDKEELYIIISVQGEYVYLSDGPRRPLNKQKRKNKKHLQAMEARDEEIAGFIRAYKQEEGKKNVKSRRD